MADYEMNSVMVTGDDMKVVSDFFAKYNYKTPPYYEMRTRLFPKLRPMPERLPEDVPYSEFHGFMVTYHVMISHDGDNRYSFQIDNKLMNDWNVTESQLFTETILSAQNLLPVRLSTIGDVLGFNPGDNSFWVLTNSDKFFGASTILYLDTLRNVYDKLGEPFYLIPSSVHEWLVIPKGLGISAGQCKDMLEDVNTSVVDDSEILAWEVYHYDTINGLTQATGKE